MGLTAGADTCLLAPKPSLTDCSYNTDCFNTNLTGTLLCQRKHTNKHLETQKTKTQLFKIRLILGGIIFVYKGED